MDDARRENDRKARSRERAHQRSEATDPAFLARRGQVRQAEIALEQINIRAPFAGVFDRREAEIGTYLSPGQPCGTMIELNPLLVVGDVPETAAASLRIGAPATATLVSGQTLSGRVRYVSREADPQTRTYHV